MSLARAEETKLDPKAATLDPTYVPGKFYRTELWERDADEDLNTNRGLVLGREEETTYTDVLGLRFANELTALLGVHRDGDDVDDSLVLSLLSHLFSSHTLDWIVRSTLSGTRAVLTSPPASVERLRQL